MQHEYEFKGKSRVRQKGAFQLLPSSPREWTAFQMILSTFSKNNEICSSQGEMTHTAETHMRSVGGPREQLNNLHWEIALQSRCSPLEHRISIRRLAWQTWRLVSAGAERQISLLNLMGCLLGHWLPHVLKLCYYIFLHNPRLRRYECIFQLILTSELTSGMGRWGAGEPRVRPLIQCILEQPGNRFS